MNASVGFPQVTRNHTSMMRPMEPAPMSSRDITGASARRVVHHDGGAGCLAGVGSEADGASPAAGAGGPHSTLMGTPAYMSPEQLLRRPVDARSDQFSYCVALHEALGARHPFGADEPGAAGDQVLARILAGERPIGERAVPGWLRQVLRRGLMPDPAARYPSMHALLRELRSTPERRRRRSRIAAGVALVLATSAITWAGSDSVTAAPCVAVADELRGVWDARVRAASEAAFAASGVADAAELWQRVEPRIDEYADAWLAARQQRCRARHEGSGAPELLQLGEGCLLRRRAELAGLSELLVEADERTMLAVIEALDQLTPIAVCDDVEGLRREASAIESGADLAAIEAMRRLLGVAPGAPFPARRVAAIRMGTTVATNALLERKGEPTLLVTTRGFRDALRIAYQNRPRLFDRRIVLPELLYSLSLIHI